MTWINRKANAALVIGFLALVASISGVAAATATGPKAHKAALRGPRGPRGPRGFTGATGPQGPQGPQGPAGHFSTADVATFNGPDASLCASGSSCDVASSLATCPAGAIAVGGGWSGGGNPPVDATEGFNYNLGGNTWEVIMVNNALISSDFHAVVICAQGTGASAARSMSHAARDRVIARQIAALRARIHR